MKQLTGTFARGFLVFALFGFGCAVALLYVSRSWEGVFVTRGGLASGAVVETIMMPAHADA
jgi:hypothetical protein